MNSLDRDHRAALAELAARGLARSAELQLALHKSQPSVSRLLAALAPQVLALGRGRNARYGLAHPIRGRAAQQPLWWVDEAGYSQRLGTLSLLGEGHIVHVEGPGFEDTVRDGLPWYLAPLRAEGFLGRLLARQMASSAGLDANPEAWGLESILYAALHVHDAPGAIMLGESALSGAQPLIPTAAAGQAAALDELAADVARTFPVGSSAGGEQPKFLARLEGEGGGHVLVKFTPPRGTPFGERWHELLHAEALAAEVLGHYGVAVAAAHIVETPRRTYLLSTRFDRVGAAGRRHAVAVGAVHRAFVAGSYANWAATCEALVRQGRLPAEAGAQARALFDFGRLIGNSDMHSGNLSLAVELESLTKGRFTLAPVYDMLPMRWRPDPLAGGAPDYTAFEPDATSLSSPARAPAAEFWSRLARHGRVGKAWRAVAAAMAQRLKA